MGNKIVVCGDLHGRFFWKKIILYDNPNTDKFILLGDYFDSYDFTAVEQIHNFKEIIKAKEILGDRLILLIGNHDLHYFPEIGNTGTSGYQANISKEIEYILNINRHHLQMAYKFENIVFSHAGISLTWLEECGWEKDKCIVEYTNELWKYKPKSFIFDYRPGCSDYGDNIWQSPVWIRPKSLMKAASDFKKDIIQIVGHTQQDQIDIKGKATGSRYFFIDTLGTSGEYLVIDNVKFSSKKV